MTNDIQNQADLSKAREKLEEVARQKEGQGIVGSTPTPIVVSAKPKTIRPVKSKPKKKKFGLRVKESLFGDIGNQSIPEHLFFSIFLPTLRKVFDEMGCSAVHMLFGVDPKTTRNALANVHAANASVYRDRNFARTQPTLSTWRDRDAISDFEWDESTADDIYTQLTDWIETYGKATLAEAYTIMGMSEKIRNTDYYWGWTKNSLRYITTQCVNPEAPVEEQRWIVDVPPVRALDQ